MPIIYSHEGVTVHHGDAREELAGVRGLIVTDPPYNIGYGYDEHDDSMPLEEYHKLIADLINPPCVIIHYPEAMFEIAVQLGMFPTKTVAWVYNANTPRQWRMIAWFGITPDLSLGGQGYKNPTDKRVAKLIEAGKQARLYDWWEIQQVKNVSAEKTAHPCQIPIELMRRILTVTPFDGAVIDPFMGSGTTLRAAMDLGRVAIGSDISRAYCEIAVARMAQGALGL